MELWYYNDCYDEAKRSVLNEEQVAADIERSRVLYGNSIYFFQEAAA